MFNEGPYQPKLKSFPRTKSHGRLRSFQEKWYEYYNWLEYSAEMDGAFCFVCKFFGNEIVCDQINASPFMSNGFHNWKKANAAFKTHEKSQAHIINKEKHDAYKKNKKIDELIDESRVITNQQKEKKRQENRNILERYVEIVRKLIIGGRPFRGLDETKESFERGLFLDVVELVSRYDDTLRHHLEEGPSNAKYTSNRSQNDFIEAFYNLTLQQIIEEIGDKKISIIADETTDCGHHEQLAIVVRFFHDEKKDIVERFIGLTRMKKVDADSIFSAINEMMQKLKLLRDNVVSVCFDGARSMSGHLNGVQAKCKAMNNKIVYVHCFAHCLNLTLVESSNSYETNPIAFEFFGIVQMIYNFFRR